MIYEAVIIIKLKLLWMKATTLHWILATIMSLIIIVSNLYQDLVGHQLPPPGYAIPSNIPATSIT